MPYRSNAKHTTEPADTPRRLLIAALTYSLEAALPVAHHGSIAELARALADVAQHALPHLNLQPDADEDAYQLLHDALNRYRDEHRHLPAGIVVHKSSTYNDEERAGFIQAANDQRMDMLELVSLRDASTRLFRTGIYPPARGTLLRLDERSHVLYARGSVPFSGTYPGDFVPRPLGIRCELVEQTPQFHAQEILALTKMNWNNTQFDGADPISLRAARQVGSVLKYLDECQPIAPLYSSYM